jgi:hypothetical protein
MTQITTTIRQSKRLLNYGVKPESADYCWLIYKPVNPKLTDEFPPRLFAKKNLPSTYANNVDFYTLIPAWSLSKLFKLIPKSIWHHPEDSDDYDTYCLRLAFDEDEEVSYCYESESNGGVYYDDAADLFDAGTYIIGWLLRNFQALDYLE